MGISRFVKEFLKAPGAFQTFYGAQMVAVIYFISILIKSFGAHSM